MSTVALLQPLGHICLVVADHSLGLVVYVLEILRGAFGSIGYFSWQQAAQGMLAAAVLLLPVSSGVRGLALLCWLTLLLPPSPRLSPAEFRITVLDVGQGSAALVDTARYRLVVDAGPAYASGFNSGQSVVLPALRSTGADRLHGLLVSHGDNDHAGGADSVLSRYPRARAIGVSNACRHGRRWRWDGVDFKLLLDTRAGNSNDGSCTLLVTNGRRSAYLSGDIGVRVERRLLPELPRGVDLLVAPHHGSTTSSSTPFVEHLCPKFVVFSAGRHNRYGHPRKSVVARYVRVGARYVVTGLSGAAVWRSDQADVLKTWRGGRVNAAAGSCLPPQSSGGSR